MGCTGLGWRPGAWSPGAQKSLPQVSASIFIHTFFSRSIFSHLSPGGLSSCLRKEMELQKTKELDISLWSATPESHPHGKQEEPMVSDIEYRGHTVSKSRFSQLPNLGVPGHGKWEGGY